MPERLPASTPAAPRIGLVTPVVVRAPGTHSPWEADAGVAELATVAQAADELGFDHLTCSEHVAVPSEAVPRRGGVYWDPLATFGYLAGHTRRIRLATYVLVLGYHHPLEIAKRYGTVDLVSGGRLVLGLGVGTLEEEFALLGSEFEGRGARADDALAALRASLSRPEPEYHGTHYDFAGVTVLPHAVQPRVPLWIGGSTARSLRRAATLGDGWAPFGLAPERIAELLDAAEAPPGFDVVLAPSGPLDPGRAPDKAARLLGRAREAGATRVSARIQADSADHYCAQLKDLAELAAGAGFDLGDENGRREAGA